MSTTPDRELTTLECIVLGLINEEPQSGYSIISTLEQGTHRWSASPGSIYPILKRLEKQQLIVGELEMVYETRPRKMYHLMPSGETALDIWLTSELRPNEVLDERDLVLIKFLFMEKRLSPDDIFAWLESYEQLLDTFDIQRRVFYEVIAGDASLHQQLIHEVTIMELNMQRTWVQLARRRIQDKHAAG
ncbi:MAG: PadR family transcriptional regulator [Anaerolineae bacterium]|nr:PadR family transcriptional regulator [Anaerolineae bacterium]